jgi:hypothetical protein
VLAAELLRYKRTIGDLELRICAAQRKQRHFDATLSTVHRAWHQLDDDLSTVAKHILPPVAAPAAAAGESNALYEALLTSTAHLSLVDITDSAALKLTGVALPQRTEADEPDPLVPSSDLSDGEAEDAAAVAAAAAAGGIAQTSSSSSSSAAASEAVVGQVTAALAERLQFTNAVMGQVVAGMQRVFTTTTAGAAAGAACSGAGAAAVLSLNGLQTELLAQKRTLTAEVLLMRDQLSLAHQRARELSREVRAARRERHRALRKLEQLAAVGVAIPEDNAPLANKPLVPGSSPSAGVTASAHRMSLSDGDAMDVSKLLSAVPALGSSSAQQQQQQQMSTPGAACQHTVPGGWSAAAAAAGGSSSSGHAASADAEGGLSAQAAEALRADLAALTEAADRRLAEADQLRRDKVELEQEVTRLTARSPAAAALAAAVGGAADAAAAGAGAAAAAAAAAEDAALQQQLMRHPEVLKLQLALETAQKAWASESARATAAVARAKELDTQLQQVSKAHETALAEVMATCQAHSDEVDKMLAAAEAEKNALKAKETDLATRESKLQGLIADRDEAYGLLKDTEATYGELETKVKKAEAEAKNAQDALQQERAAVAAAPGAALTAAQVARLQAELASTRSELASCQGTVEALMVEVEATNTALHDVKSNSQRVLQTRAGLDDSNLQLTRQVMTLQEDLEKYTREKAILDARHALAEGIEVSNHFIILTY